MSDMEGTMPHTAGGSSSWTCIQWIGLSRVSRYELISMSHIMNWSSWLIDMGSWRETRLNTLTRHEFMNMYVMNWIFWVSCDFFHELILMSHEIMSDMESTTPHTARGSSSWTCIQWIGLSRVSRYELISMSHIMDWSSWAHRYEFVTRDATQSTHEARAHEYVHNEWIFWASRDFFQYFIHPVKESWSMSSFFFRSSRTAFLYGKDFWMSLSQLESLGHICHELTLRMHKLISDT